jgi:hypothetical protein
MIGLIIIVVISLVSLGIWMNSVDRDAGMNAFKDFVIAALAGGIFWYNYR